jgi:hypothetical protein
VLYKCLKFSFRKISLGRCPTSVLVTLDGLFMRLLYWLEGNEMQGRQRAPAELSLLLRFDAFECIFRLLLRLCVCVTGPLIHG